MANASHPDAELVARCLNGDDSAWRELVERYYAKIYRIAYHRTYDRGEAEELTQDCFLKVWENLDRYVPTEASLIPWMVALYTLTYVIWTVGAIPYYSLGAELTDEYHERTRVIAVREAFSLAGLLVATILPAYLIDLYGGLAGYSFMGGILGLGTAVFLLATGLFVAERPELRSLPPTMGPYAGWVATLANPHFRRLLLAFTLSAIAGAVPATLVIYVSVYVIGTPDWWARSIPGWLPTWSYYLLVYFSAGVLSLPLWSLLARRTGKRATWGAAIALATATSASCWWLAEGSVGLFTAILVLGGMSFVMREPQPLWLKRPTGLSRK